jgi:hypothetical protein
VLIGHALTKSSTPPRPARPPGRPPRPPAPAPGARRSPPAGGLCAQVVETDLHPTFKLIKSTGDKFLRNNDPRAPLRFMLYDWDLLGRDELIGCPAPRAARPPPAARMHAAPRARAAPTVRGALGAAAASPPPFLSY